MSKDKEKKFSHLEIFELANGYQVTEGARHRSECYGDARLHVFATHTDLAAFIKDYYKYKVNHEPECKKEKQEA